MIKATHYILEMDDDGIGFAVSGWATSYEQARMVLAGLERNDPNRTLVIADEAEYKRFEQREQVYG